MFSVLPPLCHVHTFSFFLFLFALDVHRGQFPIYRGVEGGGIWLDVVRLGCFNPPWWDHRGALCLVHVTCVGTATEGGLREFLFIVVLLLLVRTQRFCCLFSLRFFPLPLLGLWSLLFSFTVWILFCLGFWVSLVKTKSSFFSPPTCFVTAVGL